MQSALSTFAPASNPPVRRWRRLALGTAVTGVALSLLAGPAAWGTAATPKAPVAQPKAAEGLQPYVPQDSCDPVMKPGVKKFRDLMLATYPLGSDGGSTRSCTAGGTSEHYEGRAWDYMLSASNKAQKAQATAIIAWLLKAGPDGQKALEARRLGIMYIMYNHRIWGTWDTTWKPIRKGNDQHTTHIHFSFSWAGAEGHTSFWTGKVGAVDYGPCAAYRGQPARIYTRANPKPCPTNLPAAPLSTHKLAWTGSSSADVTRAEAMLGIPAAARTKVFGTTVRRAVIAYQRLKKLPVTGALDKDTWVSLDPKSRLATTTAPTTSGNATASSSKPAAATWVTVELGSKGAGVLRVQKALRMPSAQQTSTFDAATLAAVKAFQKAHPPLAVDGIVGPLTAAALGLVA